MSEIKVGIGAKLNASFQSTVEKVKQGVRETVAETKKIAAETAKMGAHTAAVHASFSVMGFVARRAFAAILPSIAGVLGGLSLVLASVKILSGTMWLLERATGAVTTGLSKFGMIEDLATKLRPITGSVEAAKNKLRELAEMAKGTNISLPDAVSVYRSTQVQTGGALSDRKGMTMLGDVAAASGNGITETADAVGKLYGDLQSGQPIDDATKKLRDMGIISGEVQKQIYLLAYQGKSGAEIWQMLTKEFQRSSGAMAEARDNLTTLQAGLATAKDNLYALFAEDSAPEAKNRLKAQTQVLEDLQPAAKEAGSLFASLKGIWGDTTTQLNELYHYLLQSMGSLKAWVDVAFVAVAAASAFAAATLLAIGPLAIFGTLTVAAMATIGGFAAAVVAVASSLFVYAHHLNEVNEHQLALMRGTDEVVSGLRRQRNEIVSVTDKAIALAKAYDQLKNAREALANAKTGKEKEEFRFRAQAVEAEIRALEKRDDSKLKGSAARQQSEKDLKSAKDERDDFTDNPEEKLASAREEAETARKKQKELQDKLDGLKTSFAPGGTESDAAINAEIANSRATIKASQRRVTDATKFQERAGALGHDFEFDQKVKEEKDLQAGQQNRINALLAQKAGRTQRIETARTEVAAQNVVVEKAGTEELKAERANEAYQARLAELAAEKQIAELQTQGLQRAREEWEIKKTTLAAQLQTAQDNEDKTKEGEISAQIAQGDAALQKQERAAAAMSRELAAERELAALQGDGIERLTRESDIRLGLIEARWKEAIAAQDAGEADKQRLAYYQEQVRAAREMVTIRQREREAAAETATALTKRQENYDKRQADTDLATNKITPEQHRALEVDNLRKKQREAYEEAERMRKEADQAQQLGQSQRAEKLGLDAIRKDTEGDTLGFDAGDLERKLPAKPVADSLARLGLGGSVSPLAKDPTLAVAEKQARTMDATLTVLKEIRDQSKTPARPSTFGR